MKTNGPSMIHDFEKDDWRLVEAAAASEAVL